MRKSLGAIWKDKPEKGRIFVCAYPVRVKITADDGNIFSLETGQDHYGDIYVECHESKLAWVIKIHDLVHAAIEDGLLKGGAK